MNARWMVSLAAATSVLLCGALAATAADSSNGQNQPAIQAPAGKVWVSNLIGTKVLYPHIQVLGQIKDILLDPQSGQATFAVLDAEIPGSGHAMLVVPYQALQVSFNPADNRQSVMLNVRSDRLGNAPQLQKNEWQLLQNPQFLQQVRDYYQAGTYTVARPIESPNPPAQYVAPPCVNYRNASSDLPQDLVDFYNE